MLLYVATLLTLCSMLKTFCWLEICSSTLNAWCEKNHCSEGEVFDVLVIFQDSAVIHFGLSFIPFRVKKERLVLGRNVWCNLLRGTINGAAQYLSLGVLISFHLKKNVRRRWKTYLTFEKCINTDPSSSKTPKRPKMRPTMPPQIKIIWDRPTVSKRIWTHPKASEQVRAG